MCFVQETASTIHPSIQVTFDCPSKHENVKMPVLDLEVWPAQELDPLTREMTVRIMHEHYSKEVASKAVVHADSALPWKTKRTIHTGNHKDPEELQQIHTRQHHKRPHEGVCETHAIFRL